VQTKPNQVTEEELRESVSKYGQIDEIRPAFIHVGAAVLQIPGMASAVTVRRRRQGPAEDARLPTHRAQSALSSAGDTDRQGAEPHSLGASGIPEN
jgi:hypothetical protein